MSTYIPDFWIKHPENKEQIEKLVQEYNAINYTDIYQGTADELERRAKSSIIIRKLYEIGEGRCEMMRKTKYYITTRANRKNFLLKYGDWMFKYVPESKTWEASDYWYEEIIMNDFTDFEEITEERAKEIIASDGVFQI